MTPDVLVTTQVWLYTLAFGIVFLVAISNPSGFLVVLEVFTSLGLNLGDHTHTRTHRLPACAYVLCARVCPSQRLVCSSRGCGSMPGSGGEGRLLRATAAQGRHPPKLRPMCPFPCLIARTSSRWRLSWPLSWAPLCECLRRTVLPFLRRFLVCVFPLVLSLCAPTPHQV